VKVTGSITLHNDASFQTTVVFHSHLLDGDTSTTMVTTSLHWHSLGGDTDKSNTVRAPGAVVFC